MVLPAAGGGLVAVGAQGYAHDKQAAPPGMVALQATVPAMER